MQEGGPPALPVRHPCGTKAKPLAAYRAGGFAVSGVHREKWPVGRRSPDDPNPAKPEGSCKGGAYPSSAVQKRTEIGTINPTALRERGLTSLAFNCRPHQIGNVIIIKQQEITRFPRRLQSDVIGTSHISGHVSTERAPVRPKPRKKGRPFPLCPNVANGTWSSGPNCVARTTK
jgi:hypothetical protein